MAALVVEAVVHGGRIHILDREGYLVKAADAAKAWGDGVCLRVRIEPEPDAISDGQRKYYFGRIIQPLVDITGYHKDEWHGMLKTSFFPDDGRTSITQLSHDEMRDYMDRCEQYARERHPEAFALYD